MMQRDGVEILIWGEAKAVEQKSTDVAEGIVRGRASTNQIDRDGERLESGLFDKSLPKFLETAPLQWAHDGMIPVVGRVLEMKSAAEGYPFVAQFNVEEALELGQNLSARPHPRLLADLYHGKWLNAFSVGFLPNWDAISDKDADRWEGQSGPTFLEGELLELSCCNVGSNRQAVQDDTRRTVLAAGMKAIGLEIPTTNMGAPADGKIELGTLDQVLAQVGDAHVLTLQDVERFVKFRRVLGHRMAPDRIIGYTTTGASALQSFRFPTSKFNEDAAAAHCAGRSGTFLAFGGSRTKITSDEDELDELDDVSVVQSIRHMRRSVQSAIEVLKESSA